MSASRRTAVSLVALALALSGCGSDEPVDDPTVVAGPTSASPAVQGPGIAPVAPAGDCEGAPSLSPAPESVSKDLSTKPEIPKGPAKVDALLVSDVVVGTGAVVCTGQPLEVKYVGAFPSGEQFDASWDRGADETFPFSLGAGNVIQGWDQGLIGMREGGRRVLTIPGDLAYGPSGRDPIPPDATLVFVVDLVKAG